MTRQIQIHKIYTKIHTQIHTEKNKYTYKYIFIQNEKLSFCGCSNCHILQSLGRIGYIAVYINISIVLSGVNNIVAMFSRDGENVELIKLGDPVDRVV